MIFIPSPNRIEVKPLKKDSPVLGGEELVELGEIISVGPRDSIYNIGDIIAFEGWGCTKIVYGGETKWVVSTDSNVILGRYAKE